MKKISLWLIAILLFGLGLRLLCWYLEPTVSRDGCLYLMMIQTWHSAGGFQGVLDVWKEMWIPPLPLYLMKCLMDVGFSAEAAGITLNITLGALAPLWTYGIAYEITQRRDVSICAALFAAVNPSLNMLSAQVQRDMIYLSLIGIALWMICAGLHREKWILWLASGFFAGCAMLTRFETLEMLAIIPAALLFLCIAKHLTWKKSAAFLGVFLLSFAGSMLLLSCLMQTNHYICSSYDHYYRYKLDGVIQKFKQND